MIYVHTTGNPPVPRLRPLQVQYIEYIFDIFNDICPTSGNPSVPRFRPLQFSRSYIQYIFKIFNISFDIFNDICSHKWHPSSATLASYTVFN